MKTIFAATILLTTSSAFAASPSLSGKWAIHDSIAGNESDLICNLTASDAKLSGSCKSSDSDKEIPITGSIDGDKVTWKYDVEYNGSPITLTYTATLSGSEKFSGNVDVAPFGVTGDFTAILSKDAVK
jgi:hypothetical protein